MDIECYTISFNNYFETFGQSFYRQYLQLNKKPKRFVIYSDKPIEDKPKEFENIIVNESDYQYIIDENNNYKQGMYRQNAVDHAKCEWLANVDIDDFIFPNFLDFDFNNLKYKCIVRSFLSSYDNHLKVERKKRSYLVKASELKNGVDNYFNYDEPKWCFANMFIVKSSVAKEIGYIKNDAYKGYEDTNFMINFIDKGYHKQTYYHDVPSFFYNRRTIDSTAEKFKSNWEFTKQYFNKIKTKRNNGNS